MAAKRIYQIAKEFEHDEKEIIEFLTAQGIKVGNRLSAVSDDTYNLLKAKFTAPPEPEPVPEPKPEPVVETPAPNVEGDQPPQQGGGKKKKKKNKNPNPQGDANIPLDPATQGGAPVAAPVNVEALNAATQAIYREAIEAGNNFIENYRYSGMSKKQYKALKPKLTGSPDSWAVLCEHRSEYPDYSPVRYWQAINKLATKAFKLLNVFGLAHREFLADMRQTLNPVGAKYEPREIFTDEENRLFEEQQKLIFRAFGHGMGAVNDRLYEMKIYAERMKAKHEYMSFLEYITNPNDELKTVERVPFGQMAEMVSHSVSGIARRCDFFHFHKERIIKIVENFFEWLNGYAELKAQGAPAEKVEKYLALEKKFIALVEFMAFDNLLSAKKDKPKPFEILLDLLNNYRDTMDDPDAERNFKYKVRGVTNITYKPKEYVFLYQFGDLEPQKDYRPPEEIAAAEAAAKAKENPDDDSADGK